YLHAALPICQCTAGSCPNGCCSNNMCLPGNTAMACGTGGVACKTCMMNQACNGGVCGGCPNNQTFCNANMTCVASCSTCMGLPYACAATNACVANCNGCNAAPYGCAASNTCIANCLQSCGGTFGCTASG